MRKVLTAILAISVMSITACKTGKEASKEQPYTQLGSGIKYKVLKKGKSKRLAQEGDYVAFHITTYAGNDSLIFDSKEAQGGQPVVFPVAEPAFNGDLRETFKILHPGDSAEFLVPVDTLRANKQSMQPWMKDGEYITYIIELESIKTQAELDKERTEKAAKEANPNAEDEELQKYFKDNKITDFKKTSTGMYYVKHNTTDGTKPIPGKTVVVNYTGKLMNGTVFDSNVDPKFNHVQPFEFPLGRGRVIRGWDEGIGYLRVGEKATLYIPSYMAYGANPPTAKIPPNATLIFDVELVDIK